SVLTVLVRLLEEFAFHRALVVAPIRVARQTWPTEIAKWRHTAGLPYSLVRGEDDDPEVEEAVAEARREATAKGITGDARQRYVQQAKMAAKYRLRLSALRSRAPVHI